MKSSIERNNPPIGVLIKRCFENMQQILKKAVMPKCDFNKAAKQLLLLTFTVNLLYIFKPPFYKNTDGGLFFTKVTQEHLRKTAYLSKPLSINRMGHTL